MNGKSAFNSFSTQGILAAILDDLKKTFMDHVSNWRGVAVVIRCNFCIKICLSGYFA
ncbi:hypothetical protein JCM18901_1510 [Psychrobacter sp. JCM 18901]|nr:hypothetical protein JCM18901_1510 [Psychrobacter sp. JCM 18901]